MGVYTIRDLDRKTKGLIQDYAAEQGVNIAEAVRELVLLAFQHLQHSKKENEYSSFFDLYPHIRFKGGKALSKEHDTAAYGL